MIASGIVSFGEDGTMWVIWPERAILMYTGEDFGTNPNEIDYGLWRGKTYYAGRFETWPEASAEIIAAIQAEDKLATP